MQVQRTDYRLTTKFLKADRGEQYISSLKFESNFMDYTSFLQELQIADN